MSRSVFLFALLVALGCQNETKEPARPSAVEPSPNASILPAPLASDLVGKAELPDASVELRDGGLDAGVVVPTALRADVELEPDAELLRDATGTVLRARWRWLDLPVPPRSSEVNAEVLERLRSELTFDFTVELALSRMRLTLSSDTFMLPRGTELRARVEHYGHVLVWPDGSKYTQLPAGSLRAALNERRSDMGPLARAKPGAPVASEMLGLSTERRQLSTPHGRLDLDQARVIGSGQGGLLLCRSLVELAGADPENTACAQELVPLRAEYTWSEGGRAVFEVTKQQRVSDLKLELLATPPPAVSMVRGELPSHGAPLLVSAPDLVRFRLRPVAREKPERREAAAVKEGLSIRNRGELSPYVLIDGVPVLRASPRSEDLTLPLLPGTYSLVARDFLGTVTLTQSTLTVPARVVLSEAANSER